jgi:hypothetical protein
VHTKSHKRYSLKHSEIIPCDLFNFLLLTDMGITFDFC